MTLLQLRYFCTIVQYMNYNKASKELYVTEPTLSKSITSLEKELGFYLFERSGRHIELTKYGEMFYKGIKEGLEIIEDTTKTVQRMAHEMTGHIDVSFNPPFAQKLVPDYVSGFLAQENEQQVTFQFIQASSAKIVKGLLDGNFDVGFCTMFPDVPELTFVPLREEDLVVIVPSRHQLAGKKKIALSKLQPYPFIAYFQEAGLRPIVDSYLNEAMVHPTIRCTAPDERSIAAMVASGAGVSLVAKVPVLDDFDLCQIEVTEPVCRRIIYMVYNTNHYLTPSVQRFISYVRRQNTNNNVE